MPEGSVVILTARRESAGKSAVESLLAQGLTDVIFHQLDITDAASVERLRTFIYETYGDDGIDVLCNNAALAFPANDPTPFAQQARQTIDANYYGTKRMLDAFLPLMKKDGRVIGISSTAGQLGSSWSEANKARLLRDDLTVAELDWAAEEFVTAAEAGKHRERGFPGSAYGTSKALMTMLHRVLARDHPAPLLICAVCPGLCRTYMATGRGTLMSNVLWLASFIVGHSAAGGADTPVWLASVIPEERAQFHGRFVRSRAVCEY